MTKNNPPIFRINGDVLERYNGEEHLVIIPDHIKEIGEFAFRYRPAPFSIVLPEGLEILHNYAFRESGLKHITLPKSLRMIGNGCFSRTEITEIEIPEGFEELPVSCFTGVDELKKIKLPSSLRKINETAFMYCGALEEIHLPEGVTSIGESAFYDCESLKHIELPESLEVIGKTCFEHCISLKSIKIPANTKLIEDKAFVGCRELEHIEIPDGIELGKKVFLGCKKLKTKDEFFVISNELIRYNGSAEHVVIPESITKISAHAFWGCKSIKRITFPAGLESIGYGAFKGCTGLTSVTLPAIKEMEGYAFSGCTSLRKVRFSYGLQDFKYSVFFKCRQLREISLPASLSRWSWRIFNHLPKLDRLICVPGSPACQIPFILGIKGVDKDGNPLEEPEINNAGWIYTIENDQVILQGRKDSTTGIWPQGNTENNDVDEDGYYDDDEYDDDDGYYDDDEYKDNEDDEDDEEDTKDLDQYPFFEHDESNNHTLIVPQTLEGLPVTTIAPKAISGSFSAVYIPEGVKVMEADALDTNRHIYHEYVNLPLSLEKVSKEITKHGLSDKDRTRVRNLIMNQQSNTESVYEEDEFVGTGNRFITEARKNNWVKFDKMSHSERCKALRHYLQIEGSPMNFGWQYCTIELDNYKMRFRISDVGDTIEDFIDLVDNLEHGDAVEFGWSDEPGYYGWYLERRGDLVYVEFPKIAGGVYMTYTFFWRKTQEMEFEE